MADSTDALTSPTVTVTKGTKREAELDDVSPSKIKALKASARNGRNGETVVGDDALKHKNGDDHDEDDDDDDDDDDDVVGEGGDYDEEDGSDDDYDDDDDVENGEEDEGDSKASAGKSNGRRVAAAGASVDSGANDSGDGEEDDEEDDEQE